MGIVFFVNLPIVWKSVEWWRGSLHPRNVTMTGDMRQILLFSMLAWVVFYLAVLERRLRLEWAREAASREADNRPLGVPALDHGASMTYAIVAFLLSALLWAVYLLTLSRRLRRAAEGR